MHRVRSKTGRLALLGVVTGLMMTGCLFSNDDDKALPKPAVLNPESDLFIPRDVRLYKWTEGLTSIGSPEVVFQTRTVNLTNEGDTLIDGNPVRRLSASIDSGALPAALFSQMGLNPARLRFDTVGIPDPGPGLRFPDSPHVGWRLDTTVEDLRHVRVLTSVKKIKASGRLQECWVFTDSTYWGTEPVALSTTWVGARGVARFRREWKPYAHSESLTGTLWREIKAQ